MTLKKGLLTLFYKVLSEARTDVEKDHISLADARIRDGLASKAVFDHLHDFEEARKKIFEEFCIKDKDGNPDLLGESYQFDKENVEKMSNEVKILENETVEIAIPNVDKVKQFIENTKYEPKVGETLHLDEIIMALN